jgi:hypothetical protein
MFINAIALHAVPCSIELNGRSKTPFFARCSKLFIYLMILGKGKRFSNQQYPSN